MDGNNQWTNSYRSMVIMVTIDQVLAEIIELVVEYRPQGESIDSMFYSYDYDSDTHWIKLGIPSEWCDDEEEDE